ncbi:hypothetical protein Salat_0118600 [Sesamum alatum]|uniref:Uncharacterized protein n=1 Tax=Sesamum alatum TaxID=300844 RepID=A0AAE1YX20_9LAMI|nr:hypothetical protein Salat_0118600 [Sesamum alatum]
MGGEVGEDGGQGKEEGGGRGKWSGIGGGRRRGWWRKGRGEVVGSRERGRRRTPSESSSTSLVQDTRVHAAALSRTKWTQQIDFSLLPTPKFPIPTLSPKTRNQEEKPPDVAPPSPAPRASCSFVGTGASELLRPLPNNSFR